MKKVNAISNGGTVHSYYEVSESLYKSLMKDFLNRRKIEGTNVIEPLQEEFNKVDDIVPIGTKEVIEYEFRGHNVVNPKKLMYYSKKLNAMRFPSMGEYYKTSNFVD